jgi:hypothetical protein
MRMGLILKSMRDSLLEENIKIEASARASRTGHFPYQNGLSEEEVFDQRSKLLVSVGTAAQ